MRSFWSAATPLQSSILYQLWRQILNNLPLDNLNRRFDFGSQSAKQLIFETVAQTTTDLTVYNNGTSYNRDKRNGAIWRKHTQTGDQQRRTCAGEPSEDKSSNKFATKNYFTPFDLLRLDSVQVVSTGSGLGSARLNKLESLIGGRQAVEFS